MAVINRAVSWLVVVLVLWPAGGISASEDGAWSPKLEFTLEESSYIDTLRFIAGASYALEYSRQILIANGWPNYFCLPQSEIVTSKILVTILNEHPDVEFSAEKAMEAITIGLAHEYPCNQNEYGK